MKNQVVKILGCDEESIIPQDSSTLVLRNQSTRRGQEKYTCLEINSKTFSTIGNLLKIETEEGTREILRLISEIKGEKVQFPGVKFDRVSFTDTHITLEKDGQIYQLIKVDSSGRPDFNLVREIGNQVKVREWTWEKF